MGYIPPPPPPGYRALQPVGYRHLWVCAYCGGAREDAATCPGCGAPRSASEEIEARMEMAGASVTIDTTGPGAFRRLRFDPADFKVSRSVDLNDPASWRKR